MGPVKWYGVYCIEIRVWVCGYGKYGLEHACREGFSISSILDGKEVVLWYRTI